MVSILALDAATKLCGYAFLKEGDSKIELVCAGNLKITDTVTDTENMAYRLLSLADQWSSLIETHKPSRIAIEDIKFNAFAPNLSSLAKVAMAIGVAQMISARHGFEPILLTASTVRARIENKAKSKKKDETRRIVNNRFKDALKTLGFEKGLGAKHNDISDAIALGWVAFSECPKN